MFNVKMGSLTVFSLERRDPLPVIGLTAEWPYKKVQPVIKLFVAGVILLFTGLLLLPMIRFSYPLTMEEHTFLVGLSLILIIGGIFVFALSFVKPAYTAHIQAKSSSREVILPSGVSDAFRQI
jgi:hypothetical protein